VCKESSPHASRCETLYRWATTFKLKALTLFLFLLLMSCHPAGERFLYPQGVVVGIRLISLHRTFLLLWQTYPPRTSQRYSRRSACWIFLSGILTSPKDLLPRGSPRGREEAERKWFGIWGDLKDEDEGSLRRADRKSPLTFKRSLTYLHPQCIALRMVSYHSECEAKQKVWLCPHRSTRRYISDGHRGSLKGPRGWSQGHSGSLCSLMHVLLG